MKRFYRYLCFAKNGIHAIKSKQPIQTKQQVEWLERQCGAAVYLAVLL